jgi:uncharacterized protein
VTEPHPGYRCPTCDDWVAPGTAWRPFCSERCKGIDLGHWLAGRYKIPGREDDPDGTPAPRSADRPIERLAEEPDDADDDAR